MPKRASKKAGIYRSISKSLLRFDEVPTDASFKALTRRLGSHKTKMQRIAISGATGYVGLALAITATINKFEVYSVGVRFTDANKRQRAFLSRLGVKPLDIKAFPACESKPFKLLVIATTPYQGDERDAQNLVDTDLFENVVYLGSGAQMFTPEQLEAEKQKPSSYGLNKRRISVVNGVFTLHMGFLIPDIILPIANIGLQQGTWANICSSLVFSQLKDPRREYSITVVSKAIKWILKVMKGPNLSLEPGEYGYPSHELLTSKPWSRAQIWEATYGQMLDSYPERGSILEAKRLYELSVRLDTVRSKALEFIKTDPALGEDYGHGIDHLEAVYDQAFVSVISAKSVDFKEFINREHHLGDSALVCLVSALFHDYFDDKFVNPEDVPARETQLLAFLERELLLNPREAKAVVMIASSVSYRKTVAETTPIQLNREGIREKCSGLAWMVVSEADMLEAYDLSRTFAIVAMRAPTDTSSLPRQEIACYLAERVADHIDEKLSKLMDMMTTDYASHRAKNLHFELMVKHNRLRDITAGIPGTTPEIDEAIAKYFTK